MSEFVLERVFSAPLDTVWRTWTEPELFSRWYKPDPVCQTTVLEHELEPGGVMRIEMRFGEKLAHYERWEFDAILPTNHLSWKQMLTDETDRIITNARMPDWPRVMRTTIDLEEHINGTLQRLTWTPFEATETESACFGNASEFLDKGWVGGFNNQEALLTDLQKKQ